MTDKPTPGAEMKLLELFEEGKRFTHDLLKENEKLRLVVANLRNERKELEQQGVRVDLERLEQKLVISEQEAAELRAENQALRKQFETIEEENRDFADRYVKVERQNSDLLSLYVASYRLHSTLLYEEVVQIVKEIIINMIGAEVFGIYLLERSQQSLVMIGSEGLDESYDKRVPLPQGILGSTAATGQAYIAPPETDMGAKTTTPIACVPLKVGEQMMGVIAIFQLLVQKKGFESVDFELFELLGGHASTAIYVSRLYSLSERKRSTLEGFLDLLKADVRPGP
jgi:hypothetical protein